MCDITVIALLKIPPADHVLYFIVKLQQQQRVGEISVNRNKPQGNIRMVPLGQTKRPSRLLFSDSSDKWKLREKV